MRMRCKNQVSVSNHGVSFRSLLKVHSIVFRHQSLVLFGVEPFWSNQDDDSKNKCPYFPSSLWLSLYEFVI